MPCSLRSSASPPPFLFKSPLYRPHPTLIVPISVGRGLHIPRASASREAVATGVPRRNHNSTHCPFVNDCGSQLQTALTTAFKGHPNRQPPRRTAAPQKPLSFRFHFTAAAQASLHRPAPRTRSRATLIPLLRPLDRRKELLSHISPVSSTALILALQYLRFTSAVPTFCDRSPFLCRRADFLCRRADFLCRRANFFCRRSTHAVRPQHPPTRAYRRPDSPIPPPKSAAPSCPVLPPQPDSFATTSRPAFDHSQIGRGPQPDFGLKTTLHNPISILG